MKKCVIKPTDFFFLSLQNEAVSPQGDLITHIEVVGVTLDTGEGRKKNGLNQSTSGTDIFYLQPPEKKHKYLFFTCTLYTHTYTHTTSQCWYVNGIWALTASRPNDK